jgi:tripartite-type tricarboxylate transporter receptor subunit TctC
MINRRQFTGAAAAAGASVMWPQAQAQDAYPNRPVKVIIPYAAGGGADAAARVLGQGLSKELGQPFIIESRTGGNTAVAAVALANAQPDGYTLMMTGSATVSLNPLVMDKLPYDPNTDFAPIGQVSTSPFFLIVSSELGVNSLDELLKKSREMPGQIAYVSNGTGGAIHLGMELLAQRAGVRWNHVPYRGFAPAMPDLLAGRTPIGMMDLAPIGGHAKSGKIKILAVTTSTRSKAMPEVPTIAELGFPDFNVESWFALYAPAKTPPALVAMLNEKLRKWTTTNEARDALATFGMTPEGSTSAFVRERYTREQRAFGPLVKAANIKAE